MKKFLIVPCLLSVVCSFSQDIHFTQLSETPQLINPGLTGFYDGYYRGIINYRNQWPAMGKSYNTFMGAFDMPLEMKKKKGAYIGAGLYFFSDGAGDVHFGTTQGNLSVSAILPVSEKSKFSMGLQFGLVQRSLNMSDIQWPNQYNGQSYDPGISSNESLTKTSFLFFDLGAGANYELLTKSGTLDGSDIIRFDMGASIFHATMPLQNFSTATSEKQYLKTIIHSSLRYDIPGTKFGVVPSALYVLQGPAQEILFGTLVRYKINQGTKVTGFGTESAISAGVHYRFKDAICPQVYLEFADYAIGLSYDFNASSYGEVKRSAGAFEISIRYANMKGAARKSKAP